MTTRNLRRWGTPRHGTAYPRPRELAIAEQVRRAVGLSTLKAAEKRIETTQMFLLDLARLAQGSPSVREWLARWLEPVNAALRPAGPDHEELVVELMVQLAQADACEDHERTLFLVSGRTAEDRARYARALLRQSHRGTELLGRLRAAEAAQ